MKPDRVLPDLGTGLVDGPITRTMIAFALPALGSNMLQSLNASINAVWVGQLIGAEGIAATANANLVMFLILSLVFGFGMAATILIGQHMGRGDLAGMRRALGAGFSLFVLLGAASAALGWLVSPKLLHLLGTPPEVTSGALTYLRIMFLGLPFALLTIYLSMALRGVGDSLTPLLLQIPGMLLDVGLNPVLISGLLGAPKLGIAGAGVATVAANVLSLGLTIGYIYRRKLPIRLAASELSYLVPQGAVLRFILAKGIPMGLQMIVVSFSALVLLGFVNAQGTAAAAAYGASTQLWTYIQMPSIAVGMAVSAMAAQNIGAGRWERIDQIARTGVIASAMLTGALVLSVAVFQDPILHLFIPSNEAAVGVAKDVVMLVDWSFVLIGTTVILSSVTRANGATLVPLLILAISYLPGRLGAIVTLRPWLGTQAVWWSFPIGAALSLGLTWLYYRHGGWRRAALLPVDEEGGESVQASAEPAGRPLPSL